MMSILELTDSLWKWKNIDHLDALYIKQRDGSLRLNIEFTYENELDSFFYTTLSELEKYYIIKPEGRITSVLRYIAANSGLIKDLIIDCSCFKDISLRDILEALIVDFDGVIDSLTVLNYKDSIGYLCNAKSINYVNVDLEEFDTSLINIEIPAMTINCRNFIGESLEDLYDITVLDLNIACSLPNINTMVNAFLGNTVLTKLHNLQFINKGQIDSYNGAFSGCVNLVELPIFDASKDGCTFYNAFLGCINLVTIKGLVGADNSLDFSTCPNLSRMSVACIISGLGRADKNKTLFLTSKHHDELPLSELDILYTRNWLLKHPDILGVLFNGTQYIDTGIIPDQHTSIEVKFKLTDESKPILGVRDGNTSEDYKYSIQAIYGEVIEGINNPFRLSIGNLETDTNTVASLNIAWTIKINPLSYEINGESYNILPVVSYQTLNSIYLGNINLGDSVYENGFDGIIYGFKVWDNNTLIMDLEPRYNYRRQAVLYDKISGKEFYCHGFVPVTKIKIGDDFSDTLVLYGQGALNLVNEDLVVTTGHEPEMYVKSDLLSLFYISDKLTYIDFGGVTFSNLLWAYAFSNLNLLEELYGITLPLSGNCDGMFENCESLISLQLLSANKITSTTDMFKGCTNLLHWKGISGFRANDLDLQECANLTVESISSIINNLGVNTIQHTIKFNSYLDDVITPEMRLKAAIKNWRIETLLYTPLAYIQSSGTLYIDLGLPGTTDTVVEFKFMRTGTTSLYDVLYGAGKGDISSLWTGLRNRDNKFDLLFHNSYINTNVDYSLNLIKELKASNCKIELNGTVLYESTVKSYTPYSGNLFLLAGNNDGSVWRNTPGKLYYFKLYQRGELVRDLVPAKDPEEVVCLYDKVTKLYFYNRGSGVFIAGDLVTETVVKELPYQVLPYLESTGTLWINTHHIFNTKYLYSIKYENISEDEICIFGARAGFTGEVNSGNDYFRCQNDLNGQGYTLDSWTRQSSNISPTDNSQVIIEASSTVFNIYKFNGALLYTNSGKKVSNGKIPLYLFGCNNAGMAAPTKCRIYNFTIMNGEELVMNLVPVLRLEDNVICMFDLVNEEYYLNKGTEDFITDKQGGNVSRLPAEYLELEYIENSRRLYINTGISVPYDFEIKFSKALGRNGALISAYLYKQVLITDSTLLYIGIWNCNLQLQDVNILKVQGNNVTLNNLTFLDDHVSLGSWSNNAKLLLFGRELDGGYTATFAKIYYCTVYDSNTSEVIADFVSALRKVDNAVGMYDLISDTFFTGSFTAGPEI